MPCVNMAPGSECLPCKEMRISPCLNTSPPLPLKEPSRSFLLCPFTQVFRDRSLITRVGGGGYKMGKPRVQNCLRPPLVWIKLQAPVLKLPQNLLCPPSAWLRLFLPSPPPPPPHFLLVGVKLHLPLPLTELHRDTDSVAFPKG